MRSRSIPWRSFSPTSHFPRIQLTHNFLIHHPVLIGPKQTSIIPRVDNHQNLIQQGICPHAVRLDRLVVSLCRILSSPQLCVQGKSLACKVINLSEILGLNQLSWLWRAWHVGRVEQLASQRTNIRVQRCARRIWISSLGCG